MLFLAGNYIRVHVGDPFLGVLQLKQQNPQVSHRFLRDFQPFLRNLTQPNAHTLHKS